MQPHLTLIMSLDVLTGEAAGGQRIDYRSLFSGDILLQSSLPKPTS